MYIELYNEETIKVSQVMRTYYNADRTKYLAELLNGSIVVLADIDKIELNRRYDSMEIITYYKSELLNLKVRILLKEIFSGLRMSQMEEDFKMSKERESDIDGVEIIKEVIGDGEYNVTQIKALVKGKIGANKVGKLLSDYKGRVFRFKKDSEKVNGWLISVIEPKKEALYQQEEVEGLF